MCFADWDDYSNRCFFSVHSDALAELKTLVRAHFGQYKTTALMDHVDAMVEGEVEIYRNKTTERIRWMLALENPPFTNNDYYFSSCRDRYLNWYKDARKVNNIYDKDTTKIDCASRKFRGKHSLTLMSIKS